MEVLGPLDDLTTREDSVAVSPVAGRIARLPPLTPRREEVARIVLDILALGARDGGPPAPADLRPA